MMKPAKAADIPAQEPAPTVTFAKLAKAYVKMRDTKTELQRMHDEEINKLKAKMDRLEAEMLRMLNTLDSDSVRTEFGTIIRQEDILPMCSDWSGFYDWIKDNDAFDALERRIKKGFVKEYMESHDGSTPPGVQVQRQYVVRVRRNS